MKHPFGLDNKRIVITGAASGIGQATAILASSLGAELVLLDMNQETLTITKEMLSFNKVSTYTVDLTDIEMLQQIVEEIIHEKPIDGLVHCAGISSRKPLNMLKREGFSKVMDVNFFSFVELVKLFTKRKRMNDGGKIVVMSSISSIRGYKAKTEYCVSKASVDAFVRCMALELAPRRICINSVMASEVLTPMALRAKEMNLVDSSITTPLGPSQPEEVAAVISFLLSDATQTLTGSTIRIDGGACV